MKAVILSAGLGTRLGNLTKEIPKCLVIISGKTILEWQIEYLNKLGINNITVVIGKNGESWTDENRAKIKAINENIVINERNDDSSNSYSLRLAMEGFDDDLLVIDGDLAFSFEVIERIVKDKRNLILTKASFKKGETRNKIRSLDSEKVLEMAKHLHLNSLPFPYIVYGCLIKVNKQDLDIFKRILSQEKYDQKALNHLVNEFCKEVNLYKFTDQNWININNLEELEEAKKIFSKKFIVITGGYTAVGKSTTAKGIAKGLGAEIYHSALIRKELDLTPKTVEDADKFFDYRNNLREEVDRRVYAKLAEKGLVSLKEGKNVVLDAGYFFKWQRQLVYEIAKEGNAEIVIVKVTCSDEEVIKKRMVERARDFGKNVLNETPSWNTYLATKEVTETIDDLELVGTDTTVIEFDTLTNSSRIILGKKSPNINNVINVINLKRTNRGLY